MQTLATSPFSSCLASLLLHREQGLRLHSTLLPNLSGYPITLCVGHAHTAVGVRDQSNRVFVLAHYRFNTTNNVTRLSLQAQRMSVALQLVAAEEIATELRLAAASEDAAVA